MRDSYCNKEYCGAENMVEKTFLEKLWKQGMWSLCKNHLFKGLSKNSCSVNLNDTENTLLNH